MKRRITEKLSIQTILAFFLSFCVCAILISITMLNRVNVERLTMEQIIVEKSMKITDVINKLIYKTQTLATLVIQSNGEIHDFDVVANIIVDDPAILSVLIAPEGVVTKVFPVAGNEAVIGLDFFSEGAGNKEAILARDKGELVFGGPFSTVQGGEALVGRLPVYIDSPNGGKDFWGLVSIGLKYPQALERAELESLQSKNLAYEIWRTSPDTNEKQIIASSGYAYNVKRYVEKHIPIANADWYFRILPIRAWYSYPELWLMIFISICASMIVSFIVQNNHMLSFLKGQLEEMANTDPLVGIYNRRFFMEIASTQVEISKRSKRESYVIIFDLDYFKAINDQHGHLAGDKALVEVAKKVKSMLRTYDLFARYGGEEFVILVSDISDKDITNFVERIRKGINDLTIDYEGKILTVSASFGVAPLSDAVQFESALKLADDALYKAKEDGRNKAVFHNQY